VALVTARGYGRFPEDVDAGAGQHDAVAPQAILEVPASLGPGGGPASERLDIVVQDLDRVRGEPSGSGGKRAEGRRPRLGAGPGRADDQDVDVAAGGRLAPGNDPKRVTVMRATSTMRAR
jgi:hypothetical protein